MLDIRKFFRVQMEAAKRIQLSAVQDASFEPGEPLPDLVDGLRPGLLRVGERIARLIVALPSGLAVDIVRAKADEELRAPYLSNRDRRALADAIAKLSR